QLTDQFEARGMIGAVIPGASAHVGWGQEAARLVRADVPRGHACRLSQLVDREGLIGAVALHGHDGKDSLDACHVSMLHEMISRSEDGRNHDHRDGPSAPRRSYPGV